MSDQRPLIEKMRDLRTPEGRKRLKNRMMQVLLAPVLLPAFLGPLLRGWSH